ncbi:MAG: DUF296 domain-containing protein [Lachnospiraceae bacterium]|nr:DUF296 domain-containing protein [Lachnospiraceae bacterium]
MEYRRYNDTYYIRMDKGDEIIEKIFGVCREEHIGSAVYSGIGGCSRAEIQTFIPDKGTFETNELCGMLELVSLNGSIISDEEDQLFHHTHAVFSYVEDGVHGMAGGHIRSITVLYTAEIELRPVIGGTIGRKLDPETGTGFWNFSD